MEVQEIYEEWKELVQFGKLIDLRKRELKDKLKGLEGEYVPVRSPESLQREYKMAEMYKRGKTMQEIGDMYGITRERVRQLIGRTGVSGKSLGRYNG